MNLNLICWEKCFLNRDCVGLWHLGPAVEMERYNLYIIKSGKGEDTKL
jgi:hypothetical protein